MKSSYNCWWCGSEGNSGEHKFKKSDIVSEFGDTFDDKLDYPVIVKDGNERQLRGPKSKLAKFEKVLCSKCNNERSQDFDITYTEVIEYLISNSSKFENEEYIDFKCLYPKNWQIKKQDFISYFVKHFCCRLARNNIIIPREIIKFLDKEVSYLEFINIDLQNKQDMKTLFQFMEKEGYKSGFLEYGSLYFIGDLYYTFLSRKWIKAELFFSPQIRKANFPNLESFYSNSLMSFKSINILGELEPQTYDELAKYIESINTSKDFDEEVKEINKYFQEDPYYL